MELKGKLKEIKTAGHDSKYKESKIGECVEKELILDNTYYAPMPIHKTWKNDRGQEGDRVLAYVIATCHVVGVKEEYRTKDATEPVKSYRVVFTWSQDGKENISPVYENGKCINSSPAKDVFTSPKDCQHFVDRQNSKLLRRKTQDLFDDEKEAVKVVFAKNERKWRSIAYKHLSDKEISQINADDGNSI